MEISIKTEELRKNREKINRGKKEIRRNVRALKLLERHQVRRVVRAGKYHRTRKQVVDDQSESRR